MYRCYLCSIASLTANTVGSHVVSAKHRKNYLAVQHPQMFKQLTHKSKNDSLISVFAHIFWIESFGRHLDNFPSIIPSLLGHKDTKDMVENFAQTVEEKFGQKKILRVGQELKVKLLPTMSEYISWRVR